ncbi:MAG: hypothetical protein U9R41_07010 [Candidatus Marinimicrobia bacterium]|nr:hypothetical protein [Candidatus Neomarinimicrobiota bacterium]
MKKLIVLLLLLGGISTVFAVNNNDDNVDVNWTIPAVNSIDIDDEAIDIGELNHTVGNVNFDDATSSGTYDYASNQTSERKITAELTSANVAAGNLYLTLDDPNTETAGSEVDITNSYGSAVDAVEGISADSKINLSIKFDVKNVPASTSAGDISHNCKLTILAN